MRKILGLIVVLVFHVVALAQTGQASWSNLSVVKPGQNIRVIDSSSKARQGSLTASPIRPLCLRARTVSSAFNDRMFAV